MKNLQIILLSICTFYGCSQRNLSEIDNTQLKSKSTAWEANNLLGRVKSWQTEIFDATDYKFGEPVYVSKYQSAYLFNAYGFVQSSKSTFTSEYYNNNFEEEMVYLDEELGLVQKRNYKSVSDNSVYEFFQEFQYDSLNRNKQKTHRNLITGDVELSKWDYQEGQARITSYDENMELLKVQIEKYDSYKNLISNVTYNKDGELERGSYRTYDEDDMIKDSIIIQYSFGRVINTIKYDKIGRIEYLENYELEENGSISDLKGSYIEYDSNNFHSSHTIKEFKGDNSVILQKYRVEIKTDIVGNKTEEVKVNADTNRIVEKTLFTHQYYE